ncbi:MAG TPA: NUDIX domain-containing protein [Candidatus Saccharimonadales bacterium]|jgi:8-oxo-dGTP pyrophosphatase MutT (NUDIX family)
MGERIRPSVAVLLFLVGERGVYLQERQNTGYLDGLYEAIAGKVDRKESLQQAALREASEEAGVHVEEEDLQLFHVYLNNSNPDHPWLGLMYRTMVWQGEPTIMEPLKCSAAGWFPIDRLPENLAPHVRDGLKRLGCTAIEDAYYEPDDIQPI